MGFCFLTRMRPIFCLVLERAIQRLSPRLGCGARHGGIRLCTEASLNDVQVDQSSCLFAVIACAPPAEISLFCSWRPTRSVPVFTWNTCSSASCRADLQRSYRFRCKCCKHQLLS